MQSLNILIAGKGKYIKELKRSKYLHKIYVTSDEDIEGAVSVQFNTFKQLALICKAVQIDIVLVEDEKWILEGIANVMKQNLINCFAVPSNLTNLKLSHAYARNLLTKYEINVPPKINLPIDFPIIVKGDGVLKKANSIQEIIKIKEDVFKTSGEISKTIFLEKYLDNEKYKVISIFDGKHLFTFPHKNIKKQLLSDYSKKLETLLKKENADFTGFINSDLIEYNGVLYNTGFSFDFSMPDMNEFPEPYQKDFLYVCLSALYQKLNEFEL